MAIETKPTSWLTPILRSIIWLVLSIAFVLDMVVLRGALLAIMARVENNAIVNAEKSGVLANTVQWGFTVTAIDFTTMFIMAILAVVVTILMDYWFRGGEVKGQLIRRIGIVVGVELAVYIFSFLVLNLI